MRILWFSITPSLFNPRSNSYNGGGWIASLEQIVRKESAIELGVAFDFPDNGFRYEKDGVIYYPIQYKRQSWFDRLRQKDNDVDKLAVYQRIVEDFKPDLIQIFGSENDFSLLCQQTEIPIVIHMQGCIPPYHNALFPVGMSKWDFLFSKGLPLLKRYIGLRSEPAFRHRAEKEITAIQSCSYFMGRTEWDKGLVNLFNPRATYFHCEEALRDSFFTSGKNWHYQPFVQTKIVSVISNPWYKGVDLILKTAQLLKRFGDLDFKWEIYGVQDIRFYEYKYQIRACEVNVEAKGIASKEQLVDILCDCGCMVHPSYIDNSPNSVCEAQLLGIPVFATNVGGLASLIKDGETGVLFPANDPYRLAYLLLDYIASPQKRIALGENARKAALTRHDPGNIKHNLISIYKHILEYE